MMWLSGNKMTELRERVNLAKEAMVDQAVDEITLHGYAILQGYVPDDVKRVLNEIGIVLGNSRIADVGGGLKMPVTIAYLYGPDDRENPFLYEEMEDFFAGFPGIIISFDDGWDCEDEEKEATPDEETKTEEQEKSKYF